MKQRVFYADWHTRIGIGSTYYSGREKVSVNCDDSDNEPVSEFNDVVTERAVNQVWRRAFQDRSKDHIVVTDVTEA